MNYPFQQVDVFSKDSCLGNPVAVFLDSEGLSTENMQRIARWTNLSETTFVSSSKQADYRLRIFTPQCELPFAGHPTLGSAWALRKAGIIKKDHFIQECAFGIIKVSISAEKVFFELPSFSSEALRMDKELSQAMGILVKESKLITVGPRWIVAEVGQGWDIFALKIAHDQLTSIFRAANTDGITLYSINDDDVVRVRSFFEAPLLIEDPVCGSGNAAVAVHIIQSGYKYRLGPTYEAQQGQTLGRDGRVTVVLGDTIKIGGHCKSIISGTASLAF